jgi:hypothetical protein
VKPLTASEVRAAVQRLPAEFRENALHLLASAWDEGASAGLARMPRNSNPFLVKPAEKPKSTRK